MTKSKQRLTKSCGGDGGLGDRPIEDDVDTCQDHRGVSDMLLLGFGGFGLKTTDGRFLSFLITWLEFRWVREEECGIIATSR